MSSTDEDEQTCCDRHCCDCFTNWWNCKFSHQHFLMNIVEKPTFHIVIVILVLIDCILVIAEILLDFVILNEKCEVLNATEYGIVDHKHHRRELASEVLHIISIVLLGFFLLEILVKIYAFGKKWWNIRNKKMEWLDALIVIASFIIDVYFLVSPNAIAEISLLFISFRLWRIVRVINSIAQSIRSKDETAKRNLGEIYTHIVDMLFIALTKKTNLLEDLRRNFTREQLEKISAKFTEIDHSCQSTLHHCSDHSSRHAVKDLAKNLQEILDHIRLTSEQIS